jgi:hypothetical protein
MQKGVKRIYTDYSACGGMILTKKEKALPKAKAKIRSIRSIRFPILSLLAKRGEASKSAKRENVVLVVYVVVKLTQSCEKCQYYCCLLVAIGT